MKKKIKLAILKNQSDTDHLLWQSACQELRDIVDYDVVDLTKENWLEIIKNANYDGLLARPPSYSNLYKQLYDERVEIAHYCCQIPVYPSLHEIKLFENKKYLAYWLMANELPHPRTRIFYQKEEAAEFLKRTTYPLVAKTNIGASGRGVRFLKNIHESKQYLSRAFSRKGVKQGIGPRWKKPGFMKRAVKKMFYPEKLKMKLKVYNTQLNDIQKNYVIFQQFIEHKYEWRCVRIGESYFAHKKIAKNNKASGHLIKGYEDPPRSLLNFVREVTERHDLHSVAIDLFESNGSRYLINEVQCIFGQSDAYQMLVQDQAGRYTYQNGHWIFEVGDYNRLQSYLLRLNHFLDILAVSQPKIAYTA